MPTVLLLHPPLLGPAVWRPMARLLPGGTARVPDLRPAFDPPERWYDRATELAATGPADVVVAHSGAGVLVPLVVDRVGARAAVFVDAVLPGRPTSDRLRAFLAGLPLTDGRLPPWSTWWDPAELVDQVPDADLRREIEAEQCGLPLAFYDEPVPVPPSWPPARVGYLELSPAYAAETETAAARGWPTRRRPGRHLDLVTDPAGVAALVLELAAE